MKISIKSYYILVVILIMSCVLAYAESDMDSKLPYDIGDALPDSVHLDTTMGIITPPSSELSSFVVVLYPAEVRGIRYFYQCWTDYAADSQKVRYINSILVKDSSFISPEGLRIGNSIKEALRFSDGEIINTPNETLVQLPSGWNATLLNSSPYIKEGVTNIFTPLEDLKIQYFFRYSQTKDTSKYMDEFKTKLPGYN